MTKPEAKDERKAIMHKLRDVAKSKGVSHQGIADQLGWQRQSVGRALDGVHSVTLDNLIRLADAVGCEVEVKDGGVRK